jgi:hypothetical protein
MVKLHFYIGTKEVEFIMLAVTKWRSIATALALGARSIFPTA